MSEPSNGPRPRPRAARRRPLVGQLPDALDSLFRSDRHLQAALVSMIRHGDARSLRAARVILGIALRSLRAARRDVRRVTIHVTAEPRSPR